jgi:ribosomal protein S18 acetylase RimI-like enzyme
MAEAAASSALLSRIEDASINASAPQQQRWLDGWILRYCPGKARRSRCINAVAAGSLPLQQKLALATELFAQADLPMVFRVTRFSQPAELDEQLAALGWLQVDTTLVQVKTELLAQPKPNLPDLPQGTHWVQLAAPEFAQVIGVLRGSPALHRASHAQRLQISPVPYQGFAIRRDADGAVLACGQTAQEAELVGIYDVHTADEVRGQGLACLLCERMLTLSALQGAKTAYLQVQADNVAALRVYGRLGFVGGYSYHYREAPAQVGAAQTSTAQP